MTTATKSKPKVAAKKTVKKTKKLETTLVSFLLDRSGSMATIAPDVIGGFNTFIDAQAKEPGECKFVLTLFDTQGVDVEEFEAIADVPHFTPETYRPRAGTPLLDAIGKTITHVDGIKGKAKVLFVIYTDGQENSSHEYSREAVKALVDQRQSEGWEFLFLGSDIDAYDQAGAIGIAAGSTFSVSGQNTGHTMSTLTSATADYRGGDMQAYAASVKDFNPEEKKSKETKKKKDEWKA
jgi:hypothetical protein